MKTNHRNGKFTCHECGIPAKREAMNEWHMQSAHVLGRIFCDCCGKMSGGLDWKGRHVGRVHGEPPVDLGPRVRIPCPRAGIRPLPSSRPAPCPPPGSSPALVQACQPPHTQIRPSCLAGLWVCCSFTPGTPSDTPVQTLLSARFWGALSKSRPSYMQQLGHMSENIWRCSCLDV